MEKMDVAIKQKIKAQMQRMGLTKPLDYYLVFLNVSLGRLCYLLAQDTKYLSNHQGQKQYHTDYEAWQGTLADKQKEYFHVLLPDFSWSPGAGAYQDCVDLMSGYMGGRAIIFLTEFCRDMIPGSFQETLDYLINNPAPDSWTVFYACVKMLLVIVLRERMLSRPLRTFERATTSEAFVRGQLVAEYFKDEPLVRQFSSGRGSIPQGDEEKLLYELWLRLYGFPHKEYKVPTSRYTSDADKMLDEFGLSQERQWMIYALSRMMATFRNRNIESPYRYLQEVLENKHDPSQIVATVLQLDALKKGGWISLERQFFRMENTFNDAVNKLKNVEPVKYFSAKGEYSKRRDELSAEYGIYHTFLQAWQRAPEHGQMMIVEPNPLLTEEILTDQDPHILPVYRSMERAYLYMTQFPDARVGYLDIQPDTKGVYILELGQRGENEYAFRNNALAEDVRFSHILVFGRECGPTEELERVATCVNGCLAANGSVDWFLPNQVYDQGPEIRGIFANHFRFREVIVFPSYRDKYEGGFKKMVLLQMEQQGDADQTVLVKLEKMLRLVSENGKIYLARYPYLEQVSMPFLLGQRTTINKTWSEISANGSDQRTTRHYAYSPEIGLWYNWSQAGKSGQFYASALPSKKQFQNNRFPRGERLTDRTAFRANSIEAAEEKLSKRLYNRELRKTIRENVITACKNSGMCYKSLYYCYEQEMKGRMYYNAEAARELLEQDAFLEYRTAEPYSLEQYRRTMDDILAKVIDKRKRLQYWEQLNILLNVAVREKWMETNPVSDYVAAMRDRDERFREIRDGLTKKSFLVREELQMLEWLKGQLPDSGLAVGCAIRFYTGMQVGEILALTWNDIKRVDHTGSGMLIVTKRLEGDAVKLYPITDTHVRYVPCCPELYEILVQRRDYVERKNKMRKSGGKSIAALPIVSGEERDYSKYATRAQLYRETQRFIAGAAIQADPLYLPESEETHETDVNAYHGELLRSNFEYRAEHTCQMTPGEISYILGRAAANTFSKHYCDYGNPISQAILIRKLTRWDSLHEDIDRMRVYEREFQIGEEEQELLRARKYGAAYESQLVVDLEPLPDNTERELEAHITDQSGADIQVLRR